MIGFIPPGAGFDMPDLACTFAPPAPRAAATVKHLGVHHWHQGGFLIRVWTYDEWHALTPGEREPYLQHVGFMTGLGVFVATRLDDAGEVDAALDLMAAEAQKTGGLPA